MCCGVASVHFHPWASRTAWLMRLGPEVSDDLFEVLHLCLIRADLPSIRLIDLRCIGELHGCVFVASSQGLRLCGIGHGFEAKITVSCWHPSVAKEESPGIFIQPHGISTSLRRGDDEVLVAAKIPVLGSVSILHVGNAIQHARHSQVVGRH